MALYMSVIQTIVEVYGINHTNNNGGNKLMKRIMFTGLVGACGVAVYTI